MHLDSPVCASNLMRFEMFAFCGIFLNSMSQTLFRNPRHPQLESPTQLSDMSHLGQRHQDKLTSRSAQQ